MCRVLERTACTHTWNFSFIVSSEGVLVGWNLYQCKFLKKKQLWMDISAEIWTYAFSCHQIINLLGVLTTSLFCTLKTKPRKISLSFNMDLKCNSVLRRYWLVFSALEEFKRLDQYIFNPLLQIFGHHFAHMFCYSIFLKNRKKDMRCRVGSKMRTTTHFSVHKWEKKRKKGKRREKKEKERKAL